MVHFFTNISIFLGSLVGLLTILDWLLSKKTKLIIKDKSETAWYYLNEWGKIDLIDYFYRKKTLTWLSIFINSFFFLLLIITPRIDLNIFGFLLSAIFIPFILPRTVRWMSPISKFDFYFFSFVTAYFIELIVGVIKNSSFGIGFGYPFLITTHSFFLIGIFWLIIIILLKCLLATLELITLRIVESEKGPILGLSVLLIALGAIIKIFL